MNTEVALQSPPEDGRGLALCWAGWLAGPLAWAGQFLVAYVLIPRASSGWGLLPIHLTTLTGLLGSAMGGWLAWRLLRRGGGGWEQFLGIQGLMAAPLFATIILAQWAAIVLLDSSAR